MSKKLKTVNFKYTPHNILTPLKPLTTQWDLKKHFYTSENDPQIELDAKTVERVYKAFIKRFKNKDFTSTAVKLLAALEYEEKHLLSLHESSKLFRYFGFRKTLNAKDSVAEKRIAQLSDRFKKLSTETLFFPLAIGKISEKNQKKYLKDPILTRYRYALERAFIESAHHLSEPEEKILSLRSRTSCGMWEDAVEKVRSNLLITYKKQQYSLTEAMKKIDELPWAEKNVLWNIVLDEMQRIGEFAEHELTAIVTHSKVSDELRGYKKPYSATAIGYENEEKSVEALVEAVSTKGFALSSRFYKAKAKLHGVKTIPYVNKYEPFGSDINVTFEQSVEICRDVFSDLSPKYAAVFDTMLQNGQIDVFPKKGKGGGAFMSSTTGLPTFVMLNHADRLIELDTLSHEMGHAIHAEMSKIHSPLYDGFSTVTAETASTLFEQLVQQRIIEQLPSEQKLAYLDRKIASDIATIQRQIAFFNFELDMHNTIRTEGAMNNEELAKMMQKHLKAYMGPAVEVTEKDGYSYVYVPHIRYGFYVYTYAYGQLISSLMAQSFERDNSYIEKIDTFLHSGSTATVEDIFKSIGINVKKTETFEKGLALQEQDIKLYESLIKKV